MRITYNGLENASGIITLTNVPNIVSIESTSITGYPASLTLTVSDLSKVDENTEYYITINNRTISSGNGTKNFSLSGNAVSVANSIIKALRNIGLPDYNIYQELNNGLLSSSIIIRAKEIGPQYNISYDTNLENVISMHNVSGTSTDEFIGGSLNIDVYSNGSYVTTLEKNYYKEKIDFNVSEVLSSISEYDYLTNYKFVIYSNVDGVLTNISDISARSAIGYMVNQGAKYLGGDIVFAQNVHRGVSREVMNNTILYTYYDTIPITLYGTYDTVTVGISYKNASLQQIGTGSVDLTPNNRMYQDIIVLDQELFNDSFYIDLNIPNYGIIRYNVIKPIKATQRCQRVYYHNSYGGVSFFDFTGEITEEHKTENETYTKNIYDYYRDSSMEQTKIYSKENSINVTMKSHLMERDAIWQFNDFLGSYDMWTTINNINYKIICNSCKVDETETGVWQATVTYTYSLI